jgi:hypothetical protein
MKIIIVHQNKIIRKIDKSIYEYKFPFKEYRVVYLEKKDHEGFSYPEGVIQLDGINPRRKISEDEANFIDEAISKTGDSLDKSVLWGFINGLSSDIADAYIRNVLINNNPEEYEKEIKKIKQENFREGYKPSLEFLIKRLNFEKIKKETEEVIPTDLERLIRDLKDEGAKFQYFKFIAKYPSQYSDFEYDKRLEISGLDKIGYKYLIK